MLKEILNLKGVQQLNKKEQSSIFGGGSCIDQCYGGASCPPGYSCVVFDCSPSVPPYDPYGLCVNENP